MTFFFQPVLVSSLDPQAITDETLTYTLGPIGESLAEATETLANRPADITEQFGTVIPITVEEALMMSLGDAGTEYLIVVSAVAALAAGMTAEDILARTLASPLAG